MLVEEYLDGPEVSLFCVTDGETVVPLLPAQDFKRVGDGDTGPNTGGMGAYAPLPWAPAGAGRRGRAPTSSQPVVAELARRGTPFAGLLYAGLALTVGGPAGGRVQLPLRRPGDPGRAGAAGDAAGRAAARRRRRARWPSSRRCAGGDGAAVTVVVAAEGYPGTPRAGDVITGADGRGVIHAGTRRRDDGAVVSARRPGAVGRRRPATTSPRPREPPTAGRAASTWRARTTAPTSPRAAVAGRGGHAPVSGYECSSTRFHSQVVGSFR